MPRILTGGSGGSSSVDCEGAEYSVVGSTAIVFTSLLAVGNQIKCTGAYELTPVDVQNLKKDSSTTVTAVDAYEKSVEATEPTAVDLDQVTYSTLQQFNTVLFCDAYVENIGY